MFSATTVKLYCLLFVRPPTMMVRKGWDLHSKLAVRKPRHKPWRSSVVALPGTGG